MEEQFPGIYSDGDAVFTENAVPGEQVYGEQLKTVDGVEYRRWSTDRSKLAAAISKGLQDVPLDRDDAVLYLGASTGTTVSHVADIVRDGVVYAVEYAPQIARQLLQVAEARDNLAPLVGDARTPQDYRSFCSQVDVIYQDVAQRQQIDILQRNADIYLRDGGHALLAIKAQSISSSDRPDRVFSDAKDQLRESFDILDGVKLAPFHTDHLFLLLQYRPGKK